MGYSQESDVNQRWISGHILDEYGRVGSYRELDEIHINTLGKCHLSLGFGIRLMMLTKDLSRVNQDGKLLIHGIFYLLPDVLPPTVIKLGVMDRQYRTLRHKVRLKTAADFDTFGIKCDREIHNHFINSSLLHSVIDNANVANIS